MKNTSESNDLQKAGLKATLPRLKILNFLESTETRHLSAEDVYKAMLDSGDEVGLATIYRVLTQFESAGLVTRHHFEGGHSVFELNEGKHHDHIVCVQCGHVEEFYDETIEARQHSISDKHGFSMTDHALTIYGVCATCSAKK